MFDKELTNTSSKALKQYRAGYVQVASCLAICPSVPSVPSVSPSLSLTDHPLQTGSVWVWTGNDLAVPGKFHLFSGVTLT